MKSWYIVAHHVCFSLKSVWIQHYFSWWMSCHLQVLSHRQMSQILQLSSQEFDVQFLCDLYLFQTQYRDQVDLILEMLLLGKPEINNFVIKATLEFLLLIFVHNTDPLLSWLERMREKPVTIMDITAMRIHKQHQHIFCLGTYKVRI